MMPYILEFLGDGSGLFAEKDWEEFGGFYHTIKVRD